MTLGIKQIFGQGEHALKQYVDTGEIMPSVRKHDNHLSEEMWNNVDLQYQVSIQALSEESWDLIVDGAWKISQEKKAGHTASSSPPDTNMPKVNERELVIEGDEVVENDEEITWDNCELCYFCLLLTLYSSEYVSHNAEYD